MADVPGTSAPVRVGYPRPYAVALVVLVVAGVLCLLVELQSSSLILWTGERIAGTNDGGLVYYSVGGAERTLDAPGDAPARPEPVTVYADPTDSSKDRISGPAKWIDAALVLSPVVAAVAVFAAGLARRRKVGRQVRAAAVPGPVRPRR